MDAETIGALITAGSFAVSQFISVFFMIKSRNKNKKLKNDYNELLDVSKRQAYIIGMPADINRAEETIGEKNGNVKKAMVLTEYQKNCLQGNVNYNPEMAGNYIEYFLSTPQKKKKESETNGEENKTTQESRPENFYEHSQEN